ncbi:MAG: hypothetical protein ACK41Y_08985, partial [Paracoccus hibiscisoli]
MTRTAPAQTRPRRHDHALRQGGGRGWSLAAVLVAGLVLMPVLSVVWLALNPTDNIWPHLLST